MTSNRAVSKALVGNCKVCGRLRRSGALTNGRCRACRRDLKPCARCFSPTFNGEICGTRVLCAPCLLEISEKPDRRTWATNPANIRSDALRCTQCALWKPDGDFDYCRAFQTRRNRCVWCRGCKQVENDSRSLTRRKSVAT